MSCGLARPGLRSFEVQHIKIRSSGRTSPLAFDLKALLWYIPYMTTKIFYNGRSQAVRIPKELRFDVECVEVRRLGDGIYVEPVQEQRWPENWFQEIHISDEGFQRPPQGEMPITPDFTSGVASP